MNSAVNCLFTLFSIYEYKLKEPKTGTDQYKKVWR